MIALNLFSDIESTQEGIASTEDIDRLLDANAPVAIGVSGGKDSTAVSFATFEHLDRIGHTGPRIICFTRRAGRPAFRRRTKLACLAPCGSRSPRR